MSIFFNDFYISRILLPQITKICDQRWEFPKFEIFASFGTPTFLCLQKLISHKTPPLGATPFGATPFSAPPFDAAPFSTAPLHPFLHYPVLRKYNIINQE